MRSKSELLLCTEIPLSFCRPSRPIAYNYFSAQRLVVYFLCGTLLHTCMNWEFAFGQNDLEQSFSSNATVEITDRTENDNEEKPVTRGLMHFNAPLWPRSKSFTVSTFSTVRAL